MNQSLAVDFLKYEALGNDFILLDGFGGRYLPLLTSKAIKSLCDRNFGIGADGIIFITPSSIADARMKIYNSDGSVASICGNGIRCVLRFLAEKRHIEQNCSGKIATDAGNRDFSISSDSISVDMGIARFSSELIKTTLLGSEIDIPESVSKMHPKLIATTVDVGNRHLVVSSSVNQGEMSKIGHYLEKSDFFTDGANVEFVTIVGESEIDITVWERGVGLTKACGSGACAAVSALVHLGKIPFGKVKVNLPGGSLFISVSDNEKSKISLTMTGDARCVFAGSIKIQV